jgi:hypothetical protein
MTKDPRITLHRTKNQLTATGRGIKRSNSLNYKKVHTILARSKVRNSYEQNQRVKRDIR